MSFTTHDNGFDDPTFTLGEEQEQDEETEEQEDISLASFRCPECSGGLYVDEADEGPKWYECKVCDFSCDSAFDPETGEMFPDYKTGTANTTEEEQQEQPLCRAYRGGDDDPYCVMRWRSDNAGNTAGKCRNCGREVSE